MFKKIISYVIIFSILFPDIAHCGSIWGKDSQEDDSPTSTIVKRQTTNFSDSATGEWTEGTPLVQAGDRNLNSSDTFSSELPTPSGSFDFQTFAQGPQGKKFSGWERKKRIGRSSDEEEQKVGGMTLLGTSDEEGAEIPEDLAQETDHIVLDVPESSQVPRHSSENKWVKIGPTNEKRSSLNIQTPSINQDQEDQDELTEFIVVSQELPSPLSFDELLSSLKVSALSPEVQEFLRYTKVRVVDGKLNWKQGLGVLGGLATVSFIAIPLADIVIDEVIPFIDAFGLPSLIILKYVAIFGAMVNLTLDVVSRTTSLLVELTGDATSSFSLQRSSIHGRSHVFLKTVIYGSSMLASLVPIYYIARITSKSDCLNSSCMILWLGAPAFALYVTLHYGHHLSHPVESWLHHHFFHHALQEMKRRQYMRTFKDLTRMSYELRGESLSNLYMDIFPKNTSEVNKNPDESPEDLNIKEALRILQVFKMFYYHHAPDLTQENPRDVKKTIASWMGWGLTGLATIGRHLTFWYVVNEVFEGIYEQFEAPYDIFNPGPIILGGIIAGFVQGAIEKQAITDELYNLFCGKKIPPGSSHYLFRLLIKVWNCIPGVGATAPYILAGLNVFGLIHKKEEHTEEHTGKYVDPSSWPDWVKITCLVPFGVADWFTKTNMFHESSLAVINGFDSALSYCYASEGYMKDKLIRMTRELHKRFKNLDTDVLETVHQLLNQDSAALQQNDSGPLIIEDEDSILFPSNDLH